MTTIKKTKNNATPAVLSEASRKFEQQQAMKITENEQGEFALKNNADGKLIGKSIKTCFGTRDEDLALHFISQLNGINDGQTYENILDHFNCFTAMLIGINPQDELEGMLACQMVGVHNMAMEMMRRAMLSKQTVDGVNSNVNRVTKLLRTFTAQMEALNKYRGKGAQKMTVEHVHVNEGGQAIVGNESQGGEGEKNEK